MTRCQHSFEEHGASCPYNLTPDPCRLFSPDNRQLNRQFDKFALRKYIAGSSNTLRECRKKSPACHYSPLGPALDPPAASAGEKTTPTGNKPTPVSAMKAEEECVIPKLEHEEKLPSGEIIIVKEPIPETLSDKCYCEAVAKRHTYDDPYHPYSSDPRRTGLIIALDTMPDRAFRCFYPNAPKGILTKRARGAAEGQIACDISEEDKEFYPDAPSHCIPENRKTPDK